MTLLDFLRISKSFVLWRRFRGGNYNEIAVSEDMINIEGVDAYWVKKTPLLDPNDPAPVNESTRGVRKFLEMNPDNPAFSDGVSWYLPFFGESPDTPVSIPSDEDTHDALFEIYCRTGNIIADAAILGNFVSYRGKNICVDVDLANRRGSFCSDVYYNELVTSKVFDEFFESLESSPIINRPLTIGLVKILFYLDDCLSQFEGSHKALTKEMLPIVNEFCLAQLPITEAVFQNLYLLTHTTFSIKPPKEWLAPPILAQARGCSNPIELYTELRSIYQAAIEAKAALEPEVLVASIVDEIKESIVKQSEFRYHFFQKLPKRNIEIAIDQELCSAKV